MYYNTSSKQRSKLHKQAKLTLGKSIRARRLAAGLSQEEVALRLDAAQGYISKIELGQQNPTLETISELAAALDIPIEDIFTLPPKVSE